MQVEAVSAKEAPPEKKPARPEILLLKIERFRGIADLTWRPREGLNLILGGGDAGKTTILDAIALLFSPSNANTVGESDCYRRKVDAGFVIEAVVDLPSSTGINNQYSPT